MPQTLQKLTYGLVRLCVADDGMVLQRFLLWERRNNTVMPFKETVQQVWARISALRDSLDGPQVRHSTRWPSDKASHVCFSLLAQVSRRLQWPGFGAPERGC